MKNQIVSNRCPIKKPVPFTRLRATVQGGRTVYLLPSCLKQAVKLLDAANNICDEPEVVIVDGYRSIEEQRELCDRFAARGVAERAAKPGCSEHHTGCAADFGIYCEDGSLGDLDIECPRKYAWLVSNAHRYGFILRYPEGKQEITGFPYEHWHFRYVGKRLAAELYGRGITLEEYYMN
ncbi:MAG: M15 family metallopeptidase [Oscillospiraceae bacterium]|nr:M15 family metallopeptidase [Oscillospiraceae bacterium]